MILFVNFKSACIFFHFLHILSLKGRCIMEKEKNLKNQINTTPNGQRPANEYDDDDIPQVDLPQEVIPDEVPRKDGPGGESGV